MALPKDFSIGTVRPVVQTFTFGRAMNKIYCSHSFWPM